MASLGVLAQLMSNMLPQVGVPEWNPVTEETNQANLQGKRTGNETALLTLFDLKQKQASEQEVMAAIQKDPRLAQLLFGGGSTIGSLEQALGGTPAAPGSLAQPTLMPGQDPSRGAGVSPQGGGPIPPNVAQQLQPQVTPPQSTIASLGPAGQLQPQAPRNPVLEMAQRDPRAAMMLNQQLQAQQQHRFKLEEQRLDWTSKKMEHFGRVLQGVNSPESYGQAVQEIGRIDPRAAARLPQTYNKEALIPFIKQATTVKENADLQLRTMHEQTEAAKLNLQLANAGYSGLGDDVTSILKGYTEEQVKQFGGRTSPAAIQNAVQQAREQKPVPGQTAEVTTELRAMKKDPWTAQPEDLQQAIKNIDERKQANLTAEQRLKFQQEEKLRETQPLQDARKEDAGLFVYRGTGNTLPGTMPYGQVKQLQDEKDPEKGGIKLANLDEKKQLTTLKQLEPVLQQYADLVQYAYGTDEKTGKKGPLADYDRSPSTVIDAMYGQLEQTDPVFQAKRRALQGQLQSVVRGLGARGDLNAQELEAAQQMIANMDASMGLGLNLGVGVGSGGAGPMIGVKPTISIPDTPATGVAIANELIGTVNRRIGSILQHEGYAKTPTIKLQTGTPPTTTTTGTGATQPPTTPAPTPPAKPKGQQPGEIPVLGGPGMPEQYLPGPGKQSQAAPAPGKQSQAQRPGKRAVELARASGIKVMDRQDIAEAVAQTGKTPQEVVAAARAKGYKVYSGGTAMV